MSRGRFLVRWAARALAVVIAGCMVVAVVLALSLHLSFRPILSGSMRPTFAPGSAVLARPVPADSVRVGDVVLFNPPGTNAVFAHRVMSVSGPAGDRVITTKGDANPSVDPWKVHVRGGSVDRMVIAFPWIGTALAGGMAAVIRTLLIALVGLAVCWTGTRAIAGKPRRGGGFHLPNASPPREEVAAA